MAVVDAERDNLCTLSYVATAVAARARQVMGDLDAATVENGVVVLPEGAIRRRYDLHDLVLSLGTLAELAQVV